MNVQEKQYKLAVGGLLHDVGKLLFRYDDRRKHAESGYDYLKNQVGLADGEILDQVRYHHASALETASLPADSPAYITCLADNIASAADRRQADPQGQGFVRELGLDSIFNLLNGNEGRAKYRPALLTGAINNPTTQPVRYTESFYDDCIRRIGDCLKSASPGQAGLTALLEVLEATLTYLPSSTSPQEVADVSLFDHSKLTAALSCCVGAYLAEQGVTDLRTALFRQSGEFCGKKAFLLYSIDISGIQDFIYTITSDGALKALRARSFYLELLMEHLVDELLDAAGLCRANCMYCGGGHAYLLLPNTKAAARAAADFVAGTNEWFLRQFGTALYLAGGGAPCSANDLQNKTPGSYRAVFAQISEEISRSKLNRYTAGQILALNQAPLREELRECSVCRRTDLLDGDKCSVCNGLEALSRAIQRKAFFSVTASDDKNAILPLPANCRLVPDDEAALRRRMAQDAGYRRSYAKNESSTGCALAPRLWIGDYQNGEDFHALAQGAQGIRRLAVLRADVDNLGRAFVSGFESPKHGERYVTLSRTAVFSRKLALFFKRHVNTLLENGTCFLTGQDDPRRRATVVYSGGDDLFIVGAWSDILGFAVDLNQALKQYSQGTLTLSAGIGLYPEKYPVSVMARQTGELEDAAKAYPGKNAVCLFEGANTYAWSDFVNHVLEEKYRLIRDFFSASPDRGKAFLYRLLELMNARGEKINLARYAYLLARMTPAKDAPEAYRTLYASFSQNMYRWMQDAEQCRQAVTAIYIYLYTIRDTEEAAV